MTAKLPQDDAVNDIMFSFDLLASCIIFHIIASFPVRHVSFRLQIYTVAGRIITTFEI